MNCIDKSAGRTRKKGRRSLFKRSFNSYELSDATMDDSRAFRQFHGGIERAYQSVFDNAHYGERTGAEPSEMVFYG